MIKITSFTGQPVALFGLGISGLSAARALREGGAELVVFDDNEARAAVARDEGFDVVALKDADWRRFSALVLSPGVPLTHPEPHWVVKKALEAHVPIIGDTELFFLEFLARGSADHVIAITGTNGKSTTTALTRHILEAAGAEAVMGGNIGRGVLDLPDFGTGLNYVLEISSYQIDLTPSLAPTAAGLLNISPDHIDRHGTVENYAEVKSRIFDQIGAGQRAVVSIDDPYCQKIAARLECDGEVFLVTSNGEVPNGARLSPGGFEIFNDGLVSKSISLKNAPSLRGIHNAQNAAFAYFLAEKMTENTAGLIAGLNSFPGLAHRAQEIARYERAGGRALLFVNDSKATNAEASAVALASYPEIYWIAGGRAKAGGIEWLEDHLGRVRRAFLIGEAAPAFAATLEKAGVEFEMLETIDAATARAFEVACDDGSSGDANAEAAILLSPAAASFDQFANFEMRGQAFVAAVSRLEGPQLHSHIQDG